MEVLAVVSGKGGVGKTTVASNLALELSLTGHKVLLVDCNITTPHLNFYFDIPYMYTLNDVLRGNVELEKAITRVFALDFLPASLNAENLIGVEFEKLSDMLKVEYDYIILDSAPGLGKEASTVLKTAESILYVTIPYLMAVSDVKRIIEIARMMGKNNLGIVVNEIAPGKKELTDEEIETLTNLRVLVHIPFDKKVQDSAIRKLPVNLIFPESKFAQEIKKLVNEITGLPIYQASKFNRFLTLLKKIFI
jgi:MinD-like ATPase involved in chromosome partitioning or flagellar assembly